MPHEFEALGVALDALGSHSMPEAFNSLGDYGPGIANPSTWRRSSIGSFFTNAPIPVMEHRIQAMRNL